MKIYRFEVTAYEEIDIVAETEKEAEKKAEKYWHKHFRTMFGGIEFLKQVKDFSEE